MIKTNTLLLQSACFAALFVISATFTPSSAQQNIADAPQRANGNGGAMQLTPLQFNPLPHFDYRIVVDNVSIQRRFTSAGTGEFLDVDFIINNRTPNPVNVYAWVIAFNEENTVWAHEREMIPFPAWRKRDDDQKSFIVNTVAVTPQDIPPEQIWDENDPAFIERSQLVRRLRNRITINEPIDFGLPPLWKYLAYIEQNPTEGLNFTLHAYKGPETEPPATPGVAIQTNFEPPTDPNGFDPTPYENVKYTLQHMQKQTIFRSHHHTTYQPEQLFFNHIVIILFDAEKLEARREQENRELRPGEDLINPLLYRRGYHFRERDIRLR